jgi:hypothetical protein
MVHMSPFACLRSGDSSYDLGTFDLAGLAEYGQQHHPSLWREPVAFADGRPVELEPQLTCLAAELARVGLTERLSALGQSAS